MSMFVYKGGRGGQKCPEFCLRGLYTVPMFKVISPYVSILVAVWNWDILDTVYEVGISDKDFPHQAFIFIARVK